MRIGHMKVRARGEGERGRGTEALVKSHWHWNPAQTKLARVNARHHETLSRGSHSVWDLRSRRNGTMVIEATRWNEADGSNRTRWGRGKGGREEGKEGE